MQNTETLELRCELTVEESDERGKEQSALLLDVAKLEAERRQIGVLIKPKNERIDELAHIIHSGYETRMVECFWVYDWENKVKFLHRSDTGALHHQEPIRENEKQPALPFEKASSPAKVTALFEPCPAGPCVMVKAGDICSPAFCGKRPPAQTDNAPLVKRDAATCNHPISQRFQDSNALVCEACGTVLETFTTDPVALAVDAELPDPPCEDCPDHAEGCGHSYEDKQDCAEATATEVDHIVDANEMVQTTEPNPPDLDKNRKCCMPFDRDTVTIDGVRVLYCTVCKLIHRKQDKDGKDVAFITGETLPDLDDTDWPDPPKVAA